MSDQPKPKARKVITGEVTSAKMDKTVVVVVNRLVKHPVYKKYVMRRKKVYAHDEHRVCKVGDRVLVQETRPLSKLKRWRVVKVVEEAR
ncbi:MAG: hypothetical protein Kow0059_03610 [Candidatus Sumerlaeia bacterium]